MSTIPPLQEEFEPFPLQSPLPVFETEQSPPNTISTVPPEKSEYDSRSAKSAPDVQDLIRVLKSVVNDRVGVLERSLEARDRQDGEWKRDLSQHILQMTSELRRATDEMKQNRLLHNQHDERIQSHEQRIQLLEGDRSRLEQIEQQVRELLARTWT